jgi:tetratricopeptide (TPR) repeat protein
MFFKKIFNKDCQFYLEKGEKYFAEERYADARHAFQEGLSKLAGEPDGGNGIGEKLRRLFDETGNHLGRMNLEEAEHALTLKVYDKATEHLDLVNQLATDPDILECVENLREKLSPDLSDDRAGATSGGCNGCSTYTPAAADVDHVPEHLLPRERYELLIQTIPCGLRERYDAQGEEFSSGYLLAHGGEEERGADIFRKMLNSGDNDILLYELALTRFKAGHLDECEDLLNRALTIDDENPLCCLGLVQLLTDTGRLAESLPLLNHMIEKQLLTEQAILFLGDVHLAIGDENKALDSYSQALLLPDAARSAAERLIPILERRGLRDDAAHLFKVYLKGCC